MTAPTRNKQSARYPSKTERNERAARALMMRNSGATFAHIAQTLEISEQQAKNDVTRAIKEWVRLPAEQMVDRQRAILMDILRVEYPDAMNRQLDASKRHAAQDKILEVLRDERQLLGLNAPTKVQLGISEEQFAQQFADLIAVSGPGPLLELAGGAVIDAETVDAPADVEFEDDGWSNLP